MRKAVVALEDGLVLNVIEIDEGSNWQAPEGCILVDAEKGGSTGDTWNGEEFISPPEAESTPDYKALWKAATTPEEKQRIIAKKIGLEDE